VRYALSPYIKQIRFVFRGLIRSFVGPGGLDVSRRNVFLVHAGIRSPDHAARSLSTFLAISAATLTKNFKIKIFMSS
jgi:hypothetical protein